MKNDLIGQFILDNFVSSLNTKKYYVNYKTETENQTFLAIRVSGFFSVNYTCKAD